MSLLVIVAAVWLIGIPIAVLTVTLALSKLAEHHQAKIGRELDEWLDRILSGPARETARGTVLSGGRKMSRWERRRRAKNKKASRAVAPAGTLTHRRGTSNERA